MNDTNKLPITAALRLLAMTSMREFTDLDWDAFSGCASQGPMIGEYGNYTVVLDGTQLVIFAPCADANGEDAEWTYNLG